MTTSGTRYPSDVLAFIGGGNMAPETRVAEPVAWLRAALHRDFDLSVANG